MLPVQRSPCSKAGGGAAGSRSPSRPASRSIRSRQGRSSRLAVATSRCSPQKRGQSRALAIVEGHRADRIIDRPAIGLAGACVELADPRADVGPGAGAEQAVIVDMLEQQHALMLALDHRAPAGRRRQRAQHRRLGRRPPGSAWRPCRRRSRRAHQQHLRHALRRPAARAAPRRRRSARRRGRRRRSFGREILEIGLGLGEHPSEARPRLQPLEQRQRAGPGAGERHHLVGVEQRRRRGAVGEREIVARRPACRAACRSTMPSAVASSARASSTPNGSLLPLRPDPVERRSSASAPGRRGRRSGPTASRRAPAPDRRGRSGPAPGWWRSR